MPVDGITFTVSIPDFKEYRQTVSSIQWITPTDARTGKPVLSNIRKDKLARYLYRTLIHTSELEGLRLKAKEVFRSEAINPCGKSYECTLEVSGSLHKHFKGNNSGSFSFYDLQTEICHLQSRLHVNPEIAVIENIEIGVNLQPECDPDTVISNLLTYKGNTFNRYKDRRTGKYCPLKSDVEIKIYNKAFQERLPGHIMRYELHYNRMRALNAVGIKTLADLQKKYTVSSLVHLLQKAWENILIFPSDILKDLQSEATTIEKVFLNTCRAPAYWQDLYRNISRKNIKKQRDRVRALDSIKGNNIHQTISGLINKTWNMLFDERVTFVQGAKINEALNGVTFVRGVNSSVNNVYMKHINERSSYEGNECTVKIKETNVTPLKASIPGEQDINLVFCKTCGKPLHPKQRKNSVFCSTKYVGKVEAKKCRNSDSNKKRLQKINKIATNPVPNFNEKTNSISGGCLLGPSKRVFLRLP